MNASIVRSRNKYQIPSTVREALQPQCNDDYMTCIVSITFLHSLQQITTAAIQLAILLIQYHHFLVHTRPSGWVPGTADQILKAAHCV